MGRASPVYGQGPTRDRGCLQPAVSRVSPRAVTGDGVALTCARHSLRLRSLGILGIGGITLGLLVTASDRELFDRVTAGCRERLDRYLSRGSSSVTSRRPLLRGIAGHFRDSVLELEDAALTIGRDSHACQ